jgi:hypothetical protein
MLNHWARPLAVLTDLPRGNTASTISIVILYRTSCWSARWTPQEQSSLFYANRLAGPGGEFRSWDGAFQAGSKNGGAVESGLIRFLVVTGPGRHHAEPNWRKLAAPRGRHERTGFETMSGQPEDREERTPKEGVRGVARTKRFPGPGKRRDLNR